MYNQSSATIPRPLPRKDNPCAWIWTEPSSRRYFMESLLRYAVPPVALLFSLLAISEASTLQVGRGTQVSLDADGRPIARTSCATCVKRQRDEAWFSSRGDHSSHAVSRCTCQGCLTSPPTTEGRNLHAREGQVLREVGDGGFTYVAIVQAILPSGDMLPQQSRLCAAQRDCQLPTIEATFLAPAIDLRTLSRPCAPPMGQEPIGARPLSPRRTF